MRFQKRVDIIVILIAIVSIIAASIGIFSDWGNGEYGYKSIRGQDIEIYGKGIYSHMSSNVAIQGIAQDYVTLFIAVPLLIISLYYSRKNFAGRLALTGTIGYFLVTYLFYLAMAMYNALFLPYVFLASASFFSLLLMIFSFDNQEILDSFKSKKLYSCLGIFLMLMSAMIALLWLSVIVPPFLNGKIYPEGLEHYTTLIVQGFDLALFLPMAFVSGLMAFRKNIRGYLFAAAHSVLLSLLMTALTSKVIFMAREGANVIPVIFIMPALALISLIFAFLIVKDVKSNQ